MTMQRIDGLQHTQHGQPDAMDLSRQEWQLIILATHGWRRRNIAICLDCSPAHVSSIWSRIYRKLAAASRQDVLQWYRAHIARLAGTALNASPTSLADPEEA